MPLTCRRPVWIYLLFIIIAGALLVPAHAATQPYHVLILNSYSPGIFFSDREVQGVQEAFTGERAEFTIEYMDAKKITSPAYRQLLFDSYRMKYNSTRFDAIISLDDDAFQFLLMHAATLFPGTPVFFCGVNNFDDTMLAGHSEFTGVVEALSRNETIDLALQLHPGTERILVVTDQTTSGEINRRIIENLAATGRFPVPIVFLDEDRKGLSLQELKDKLAQAPPGSVVYYSDFFQDKNKVTYLPGDVMYQIAAISPVPIYAHGDQYLGHGAIGGKMNSGLLQGNTAGAMARRNLSGTPVSAIPVVREGLTGYMFDEKMVRRWNIPLPSLPPDARNINHEESLLEKYGLYIAAVAIFILVETWIIIALLVSRRKRIRIENELRSADATLRSLISANPESVFLIRPSGTIIYCNETAAARFMTSPQDIIGKNIIDLMPADIARRRKGLIDDVLRTRQPLRVVDPRGTRIFDNTFTPILDTEGRVEKIAILAIDVTESQKLQETLHRINRKLKNLAGITQTDLANRAFVIQGYVDVLSNELPEGKRRELLEKLRDLLNALVQAIGISRQYQDLGDRLPLWQDVNQAFLYALSHVSTGEIRRVLLTDSVEIYADPLLETAFTSLIRQTMAGSRKASVIRLSAHEEDGALVLRYEDDGAGISERERERLFNPEFPEYRVFFIAREILDVTGITIRENGTADSGLRFEIRVPAGHFRQTMAENGIASRSEDSLGGTGSG